MTPIDWSEAKTYTDILYHKAGGIAKITIDRPEVRNAFRPQTVKSMLAAFELAHEDPDVGVIILTGEGKEAFCTLAESFSKMARGDQFDPTKLPDLS